MDRPTVNVLSPSSPGKLQNALQLMPGRLSVSVRTLSGPWCLPAKVHWKTFCVVFVILSTQVKLWYDKVGHQLTVNVLQAVELPLRPDGRPRSAYVKIYFLPDRRYSSNVFLGWFTKESPEETMWPFHIRSDKSKRRTKTVKKTCEPKWSQTFVYTHVHRRDFRNHMLELTVWDQPRSPEEDSIFMGEVPHDPRVLIYLGFLLKGDSRFFCFFFKHVRHSNPQLSYIISSGSQNSS